MKFQVTLTRTTDRNVNVEKLKSQSLEIAHRALSGANGKGWDFRIGKPTSVENSFGIIHTVSVSFQKLTGQKGIATRQWNSICQRLILTGQNKKFASRPWLVNGENAAEIYQDLVRKERVSPIITQPSEDKGDGSTPIVIVKPKDIKDFGKVNVDRANYFDHIYDRENQIKIIHSAVVAAKESDFINRFHCVLYGPPGCGKTDILKSVGNMLGKEGDAYMIFDATSTTEAGAQRLLLDSDYIPPVMIVEEIEKTDEKSLRWMLGILDHRAEVRKTNFRIGHRARNVRMLCLATVNNMKLFRKVMTGALRSRFGHSIFCPRPSRPVMQRILEREIAKINGKLEWIEPTLKFCMDERGIDDPRQIIPICLCGRDDLLDGSYQAAILATLHPKKAKVA